MQEDNFDNDMDMELVYTLTDEEGNEIELEHLDTAEIDGELYMAFLPTDIEEDDDGYGMIILKVAVEDDEEYLITVDNEAKHEEAFEIFMQRLSDEEEE